MISITLLAFNIDHLVWISAVCGVLLNNRYIEPKESERELLSNMVCFIYDEFALLWYCYLSPIF